MLKHYATSIHALLQQRDLDPHAIAQLRLDVTGQKCSSADQLRLLSRRCMAMSSARRNAMRLALFLDRVGIAPNLNGTTYMELVAGFSN